MDVQSVPINLVRAKEVAHSLSHPTKMPCPAWGISPEHCKTGKKLRALRGTPCEKCYACRGQYTFPATANAHQKRLEGITHPDWAPSMARLILAEADTHFRWFDSGDLQSKQHLEKIATVAEQLPFIKFWLPTMEYAFARELRQKLPQNLTVRLSSPRRNAPPLERVDFPSSGVLDVPKAKWPEYVKQSTDRVYYCPAPLTNNRCTSCRACWNPAIKHVFYKNH